MSVKKEVVVAVLTTIHPVLIVMKDLSLPSFRSVNKDSLHLSQHFMYILINPCDTGNIMTVVHCVLLYSLVDFFFFFLTLYVYMTSVSLSPRTTFVVLFLLLLFVSVSSQGRRKFHRLGKYLASYLLLSFCFFLLWPVEVPRPGIEFNSSQSSGMLDS